MSSEPTLYERLGGRSGVEAVVDTFYERIMRVDELRSYFANTDMGQQKYHMATFLGVVADDSTQFDTARLSTAHAGLGITDDHFALVLAALAAVLKEYDVNPMDRYAVAAKLRLLRDVIVQQVSP